MSSIPNCSIALAILSLPTSIVAHIFMKDKKKLTTLFFVLFDLKLPFVSDYYKCYLQCGVALVLLYEVYQNVYRAFMNVYSQKLYQQKYIKVSISQIHTPKKNMTNKNIYIPKSICRMCGIINFDPTKPLKVAPITVVCYIEFEVKPWLRPIARGR